MSIVSEIKLLGAELADGESTRSKCPVCQGGSSGETSLSVTRDGPTVLYNCYRSSCATAGRVGERNLVYTKQPRKVQTLRPFTGELEPLSESWKKYLFETLGFTDEHLERGRPMYAPEEQRIAYPIYGPMGDRRGYVLRSYYLGVEPKTFTRIDKEEPHLSWYRPNIVDPRVLVVEDIPSAIRAASYFPQVVAMCGGGMGYSAVFEVAQFAKKIYWAFDNDALKESLRHHRKYGLFFEESQVVPLDEDLKDMKEKELCKKFKCVIT